MEACSIEAWGNKQDRKSHCCLSSWSLGNPSGSKDDPTVLINGQWACLIAPRNGHCCFLVQLTAFEDLQLLLCDFYFCHFQPSSTLSTSGLCCPRASYCPSSVVVSFCAHSHHYLVSWGYDSQLPKEENLIGLFNWSVPTRQMPVPRSWGIHSLLWPGKQQGCGHSRHSASNGFCSDTKIVPTQLFLLLSPLTCSSPLLYMPVHTKGTPGYSKSIQWHFFFTLRYKAQEERCSLMYLDYPPIGFFFFFLVSSQTSGLIHRYLAVQSHSFLFSPRSQLSNGSNGRILFHFISFFQSRPKNEVVSYMGVMKWGDFTQILIMDI